MRHLFIWCVAIAAAIVSGAAAFGGITKNKRPDLAMEAWPVNGFAYAERTDEALRREATARKGQLPERLDTSMRDWALRALASEPTSVVAMRTLSLFRNGEGREDEARQLMQLASKISKRDLVVNLWLIEDYSRNGNIEETLRLYDQTLRSLSYERRGFLLSTMAKALADPIFINPYYELLRRSPPWGDAFWQQAAQTAPALENAAKLRLRLAQAGSDQPLENDGLLLEGLIGQRLYDEARSVHSAIQAQPKAESGNLLLNGDFSQAPGLPPFDWEFTSSGELGAGINSRSGALEISAISDTDGIAAEQLVRLVPGRYSIAARFAGRQNGASSPAYVEIACAENASGADRPDRVELAGNGASSFVDLRGEACLYYWVRLGVDSEDADSGLELAVDRLLLTRV